jgi:enediyne biosynthesis protein E4
LVPGEAKGLAVFDQNRDGWPDFLVTRRGSPHLLFLNQGVAGRQSLAVRLEGGAQATTIASARLTVVSARGKKQIGEIPFGGGYLSQSAPEFYVAWQPQDLPLSIQVAWADGQVTRQVWSGQGTRLRIAAPRLHE